MSHKGNRLTIEVAERQTGSTTRLVDMCKENKNSIMLIPAISCIKTIDINIMCRLNYCTFQMARSRSLESYDNIYVDYCMDTRSISDILDFLDKRGKNVHVIISQCIIDNSSEFKKLLKNHPEYLI